jgi:hypothetical protein
MESPITHIVDVTGDRDVEVTVVDHDVLSHRKSPKNRSRSLEATWDDKMLDVCANL